MEPCALIARTYSMSAKVNTKACISEALKPVSSHFGHPSMAWHCRQYVIKAAAVCQIVYAPVIPFATRLCIRKMALIGHHTSTG